VGGERRGEERGGEEGAYVGEHLLHEPPMLALVPTAAEADDPPRALEAVARHLELVHRVDVLDVELGRGPVGRLGGPEVEVLVPAGLEVERVVARVEVGQLVDQVQGRLGVELGVWWGFTAGRAGQARAGAGARRGATGRRKDQWWGWKESDWIGSDRATLGLRASERASDQGERRVLAWPGPPRPRPPTLLA